MSYEREYMKYCRSIVQAMHEAVKAHVPQIRNYLDKYRIDEVESDDLDAIVASIMAYCHNKTIQAVVERKIKAIFEGVNDLNKEEFTAEIKDAMSVDVFQYDPWLEKMRGLWAQENSQLITKMTDSYQTRISQIVSDGVRNGASYSDVAMQIELQTGVEERHAMLIARDQIGTLNGQLTRARQLDVGITQYMWRTSEDERVRPSHRVRDGKIYSWNKSPDDGAPGMPIQCRCVALPVINTNTLRIGGIPHSEIEAMTAGGR